MKFKPMPKTEYRAAMKFLGVTQGGMADLIGVGVRTSNGYANGAEIPKTAVFLVRCLVEMEKGNIKRAGAKVNAAASRSL